MYWKDLFELRSNDANDNYMEFLWDQRFWLLIDIGKISRSLGIYKKAWDFGQQMLQLLLEAGKESGRNEDDLLATVIKQSEVDAVVDGLRKRLAEHHGQFRLLDFEIMISYLYHESPIEVEYFDQYMAFSVSSLDTDDIIPEHSV